MIAYNAPAITLDFAKADALTGKFGHHMEPWKQAYQRDPTMQETKCRDCGYFAYLDIFGPYGTATAHPCPGPEQKVAK